MVNLADPSKFNRKKIHVLYTKYLIHIICVIMLCISHLPPSKSMIE